MLHEAAGLSLEHELELVEARIRMKLTPMTQGGPMREVAFLMVLAPTPSAVREEDDADPTTRYQLKLLAFLTTD
jgi:hypothetical protein